MHRSLTACGIGLLLASAAAQTPRATGGLELADGVGIAVTHDQLAIGAGRTLQHLLERSEVGRRFRALFNQQGFKSRVKGKLALSAGGALGTHELPAGKYGLCFRIDEDLGWWLLVTGEQDEELATARFTVAEAQGQKEPRLSLLPIARDGAQPGVELLVRFGPLAGTVLLRVGPAGTGGEDAPFASHALELTGGVKIAVSYRQATLHDGLPAQSEGALVLAQPMLVADARTPAGHLPIVLALDGEHRCCHLVLGDPARPIARIPLHTTMAPSPARRWRVQLVATSDQTAQAALRVEAGPAIAEVPIRALPEAPAPEPNHRLPDEAERQPRGHGR